jgi:archaellum component FlaF (FlaF/FlaG flagellin family)
MKTMTINDLARTQQLDRTAMAAVRGGTNMYSRSYAFENTKVAAASYDRSLQATQNLTQIQDVVNATANGSAFLDKIHVDNDVSQDGANKIVYG